MSPADSRHAAPCLWFRIRVGFHPHAGPPRFLGQSVNTRRPHSPRLARWLLTLVLRHRQRASHISGRLAALAFCVTRPNRVHLRYGSRLRLRRLRHPDCSKTGISSGQMPLRRLHVVRAIHMADSFHSARLTRLILALQRSQRRKNHLLLFLYISSGAPAHSRKTLGMIFSGDVPFLRT